MLNLQRSDQVRYLCCSFRVLYSSASTVCCRSIATRFSCASKASCQLASLINGVKHPTSRYVVYTSHAICHVWIGACTSFQASCLPCLPYVLLQVQSVIPLGHRASKPVVYQSDCLSVCHLDLFNTINHLLRQVPRHVSSDTAPHRCSSCCCHCIR